MVDVSIKRKDFLDFISSFGDVDDLKITFQSSYKSKTQNNKMISTVAYISHYLNKTVDVDGTFTKTGDLYISELSKVKQFIKASKTPYIKLKQTGSGKTLHVIAGSSKITLPTSSTIVSHSKVPLFEKLVNASQACKWTKFHNCDLTVHGDINLEDLGMVSKMRGILNNSPIFTVHAHVGENEFAISAGKRHEANLFTTTPLLNASSSLNENVGVKSTFGTWLMETLKLFNTGSATIHFGEETVLIFERGSDVLVVVDQRA
tara:strand:- start:1363 stop:2145 length:783 start_codon:yes stop_codon:yes gene_type:complete